MYIADRSYYRTADDQVVTEGHPAARFLLVAAGSALPDAIAARYGLGTDPPAPDAKALDAPPANKAIIMPPANKRGGRR